MSSYSYCQTTQDDWNLIVSDIQKEVDMMYGLGGVAIDPPNAQRPWEHRLVIHLDSDDWGVIVRHVAYANHRNGKAEDMWTFIQNTTEMDHKVKQGIVKLKRLP